jgi:hypothetical protein
MTMTRQEAVDHLVGLSYQVASEFCVGKAENDALQAETTAALRALGVTEEEHPA